MPNLILCTGTRKSGFTSSISEARAKALCEKYTVVINELHHIDIQERNLTCSWDVIITDPTMVTLVREALTAILKQDKLVPHEQADVSSLAPHTVLSFGWHGGDPGWGNPLPRPVYSIIDRVIDMFHGLGFVITLDELTQEQLNARNL
ncbi:MAG: hypothetical protein NT019_02440 [Candidatus Adlerbacteria bacterium]|nr:hypothetical protein [Candidatus Adlerbacteria bacterium]